MIIIGWAYFSDDVSNLRWLILVPVLSLVFIGLTWMSRGLQSSVWKEAREAIGPAAGVIQDDWTREPGLRVRLASWTVTIDQADDWGNVTFSGLTEGDIKYLRARVPYVSRDGFRFSCFRGPAYPWMKAYGDEFTLGDHVVRSNNGGKARALFSHEKIRSPVLWLMERSLGSILFEIRQLPSEQTDVHVLQFFVHSGPRKDLILALNELFGEVVRQLVETGSASTEPPDLAAF